MNPFLPVWRNILLPLSLIVGSLSLHAQGTAFTYQGRLNSGTNPADGSYDLTFTLFSLSSGGGTIAGPVTNSATAVSNGLFTATVDLGANFPGADRWLEIGVRSNLSGAFSTLSPRQKITPTPYAILAGNVASNAVTSAALADTISLGDTAASGRLDVYRTTANTPAITLLGSQSQISTFGSDGQEQTRLWGTVWGELWLNNDAPNNATAALLSANGHAGGYLSLNNSNGSNRAYLSGDNSAGVLKLFNATDTEIVRLSAAGASWLTGGNLGIGTSTPFYPLEVQAGQAVGRLVTTNSANGSVLVLNNSTASFQDYGAINFQDGLGQIAYRSNNIMRFSTDGAERLRIDGNGRVGIGTATPTDAILDIEGDTHINDHDVFLRAGTDRNHGLGHRISVGIGGNGGPFLYGFDGGALGVSGPDLAVLTWNYLGSVWVSNNLSAASLTSGGLTDTASLTSHGLIDTASLVSRGNVGIGLTSPLHTLHVGNTKGVAAISGAPNKIVIENTNAAGRAAFLALAGPGASTSPTRVEVQLEADVSQNRGIFGTTSNHELQMRINNNEIMRLSTNGNVSVGGIIPTNKLHVAGGVSATAFVNTSDRNAKENFTPVDARDVLAKVAALPITRWNYKDMNDGQHLGPMAQDFYAAFGLGGSDKTITTIDPDGVALAAIQGLNEKVEVRGQRSEVRIQKLEAENAELRNELDKLKQVVDKVAKNQAQP